MPYLAEREKEEVPYQMNVCTCKPAFVVATLSIFYPQLVPRVGKVDEENKLDENEDEGSNDSKVKPHYEDGEGNKCRG